MANINKIRLSGTTYNIEDENASKTVELTQAQYDALATKEPNTYYVITDATAADITNYYDKTETDDLLNAKADTATTYTKTETDTALATKQATLVSGTNIKTINNESILGSGNIEIQGGSNINVVQTTGTSTTDVMSQDAVTNAFNTYTARIDSDEGIIRYWSWLSPNYPYGTNTIWNFSINGKLPLSKQTKATDYSSIFNFHLVETSAITTSMTSSSTDAQVPSAKAVYDTLGGLKLVSLTQAQYDALSTKDASTIYFING